MFLFLNVVSELQWFFGFRWVVEITDMVERDEGDGLPNIYYSPEVESAFITILSRIPLWSNIMVAKFISKRYCATSAESENYFKQLKSDPGKTNFFLYF